MPIPLPHTYLPRLQEGQWGQDGAFSMEVVQDVRAIREEPKGAARPTSTEFLAVSSDADPARVTHLHPGVKRAEQVSQS